MGKASAMLVSVSCEVVSPLRAQDEVPPVDRRATELRHLDLTYTFEASEGRLERGVDASHPERAQSFAKLGFVTFSYGMVSYGDAVTFGESRGIEGHQSVGWGNREILWGLSLMGLQLWNSLRAVDFSSPSATWTRAASGSPASPEAGHRRSC